MGDIDTINLFNGNLVLTLPIGQTYTLHGGMNYGLNLVYNSSVWDVDTVPNPNDDPQDTCTHSGNQCVPAELTYPRPNLFSNSGFGWFVSLGELHPPAPNPLNQTPNTYHLTVQFELIGELEEILDAGDPATWPQVEMSEDTETTLCSFDLDAVDDPQNPNLPLQTCKLSRLAQFDAELVVTQGYVEGQFTWLGGKCLDALLSGSNPLGPAIGVDVSDDNRDVTCIAQFKAASGDYHNLSVEMGPDTESGWLQTLTGGVPDDRIKCKDPWVDDGVFDKCDDDYLDSEIIVLDSQWADGYRLTNWGDCSLDPAFGQPKTLPGFSLTENLHCEALFAQCGGTQEPPGEGQGGPMIGVGPSCEEAHELELLADGSGFGTLQTLRPEGATDNLVLEKDGADPEMGEQAYTWASRVELEATPEEGSTFEGWGFLEGGDPTAPRMRCTVPDPATPRRALARMLHDAGCIATFDEIPDSFGAVQVLRTGSGNGTVHDNGQGEIDCGGDCEGSYEVAKGVRLTAVADDFSSFVGWDGDGCVEAIFDSRSVDVELIEGESRTCTAEFVAITPAEYTLSVGNQGVPGEAGHVVSLPGEIYCSTPSDPEDQCEDEFPAGSTVQLTAVGEHFRRWDGADCEPYLYNPEAWLYMDRNRSCTPRFEQCGQGPCDDLRQLTIEFAGDGAAQGEVTLVAATTLTCDGPDRCGRAYSPLQDVTMTAGTGFVRWLGDDCLEMIGPENDENDSPPQFQVTEHTVCTAVFGSDLESWLLTARKEDTEGDNISGGSMWSVVAGHETPRIDCGAGCYQDAGDFLAQSTVQLAAQGDDNFDFLRWEGSCDSEGRVQLTDPELECVAIFEPLYELVIQPQPGIAGEGRVDGPGGISCRAGSANCSAVFRKDETVLLYAFPDPERTLVGWGGDACSGGGSASPVAVQVAADPTTCWAQFGECLPGVPNCGDEVTLTIGDSDLGTVTGEGGLNCGVDGNGTCSAQFSVPTTVDVEFAPVAGYVFDRWQEGADCPSTPAGNITLGSDQGDLTCTPVYVAGTNAEWDLTVNFAGQGSGRVYNTFGDLDCDTGGGACQEADIEDGSLVRLIPEPDDNQRFDGWSGCSGSPAGPSGEGWQFEITGHTTCQATFEPATTYRVEIDVPIGRVTVDADGTWGVCENETNCFVSGIQPGSSVIVTADIEYQSPTNESYYFVGWFNTGNHDCSGGPEDSSIPFSNIQEDLVCQPIYCHDIGAPGCPPPPPGGGFQHGEPDIEPWELPHLVNRTPLWVYLSPDGSKHTFYQEFDVHAPPGDPDNVYYSHDNSFLRLTTNNASPLDATAATLEMPDGARHYFSKHQDEAWKLDRMENVYGTGLTVSYPNPYRWEINDDANRTHVVDFVDPATEGYWEELGPQISSITLKSFGGVDAVYSFEYSPTSLPWCYRNRLALGGFDNTPGNETYPLLSSITMPENVVYTMPEYTTDLGGTADCSGGGIPGALERLELPTGGAIEWDYGRWRLPIQTRPFQRIAAGVVERRFVESDGTVHGRWGYTSESLPASTPENPWGCPVVPHVCNYPTESRTHVTVTLPDIEEADHCTAHSFSSATNSPMGEPHLVYWQGLPFSPINEVGDLFLSTEVYPTADADGFCAGELVRSTAVRYDHDEVAGDAITYGEFHDPYSDTNRRVEADQTTYHDDNGNVVRTDRSGYTGLGQWGQSIRSGWDQASRVETTDYLIENQPPSPSERWILGLYDTQTVTEDGDSVTTESTFDQSNGFLECRRVLPGDPYPDSEALVTKFINDGQGNAVTEERKLGNCDSSPDYTIFHTYVDGTLESSQYANVGFLSYDADIEPNTGLASATRGTDLLETTYDYDQLGRRKQEDPPGEDACVKYQYDAAGPGPALVDIAWHATGCNGAVKQTRRLEFDGFGRVAREEVSRPGGTYARESDYNALGWKLSQSEWNAPGEKTLFSGYDEFGRVGNVTAPDDTETSFTYVGEREVERTVQVHQQGGPQAETTTERRDAFGRLIQVIEPGPDSLTADYAYDVGNRLERVTLTPHNGLSQPDRTFSYDHRGFLRQEVSPERTNPVEYDSYDALGNVLTKNDSDEAFLTYDYDSAGRLTAVRESGQTIKEFEYDGAPNRGLGKLHRAIRHNFLTDAPTGALGVPADLEVTETYAYDENDGRVLSRETRLDLDSNDFLGTLTTSFDTLGLLQDETYPNCNPCGNPPGATVGYVYNNGHLRLVRRSGTTHGDVLYHPSGMVKSVAYPSGVTDTQDEDPATAIARPHRLQSKLGATTLWDSGIFGYDGAGNIHAIGPDVYDYDPTSRLQLANVEHPGSLQMDQRTYDYDAFGNLTRIGTRTTSVDPDTNRIDANGYSYDWRGNLESSPDFGTLTYDALNMPLSRTLADGTEAWYAYTADEERVWTGYVEASGQAGEQKLSLRGLDNKVRREFEREALTGSFTWKKDYLYRGGSLLASDSQTEGWRYYHLDHLGTPRIVTDSAGNIVSSHKYWPYGEEITDPSANDNVMQYTGHERDEMGDVLSNADDLDYMHARYYTPWVGRFLTIDPAGRSMVPPVPQSWNRYTYASGNPLRYTDPDGECGGVCIGAVVVMVGTGLLTADPANAPGPGDELVGGQDRYLGTIAAEAAGGPIGHGVGGVLKRGGGWLKRLFAGGANDAIEGAAKTVDDLLEGATPGRSTKGPTTQYNQTGGMEAADAAFDSLQPTKVRKLPDGGRRGILPDGRKVNVRRRVKDSPTVEIQDGKKRIKIRYREE